MIQRIQTVFLLLAIAATVCQFFFPLASFFSEYAYYKLYIHELKGMTPDVESPFSAFFTFPLLITNVAAGLIMLLTIFLYKKRRLQMRMLRIAFLMLLVFIALLFFYFVPAVEDEIGAIPDYQSDYGIYFPFIALIFMILADRYIKKDEKLVRASDRLR